MHSTHVETLTPCPWETPYYQILKFLHYLNEHEIKQHKKQVLRYLSKYESKFLPVERRLPVSQDIPMAVIQWHLLNNVLGTTFPILSRDEYGRVYPVFSRVEYQAKSATHEHMVIPVDTSTMNGDDDDDDTEFLDT